eukprot:TRINITY_DN6297_c0_g1_i1.p2 TRINITY_DN6297_c0_g1~~TRINITY_DN6297_c0_g1_i1.p2  ORF type:complete len:179 (+),score=8.66 TRINITY_DN6297_c0_g1_i1:224-760(+)
MRTLETLEVTSLVLFQTILCGVAQHLPTRQKGGFQRMRRGFPFGTPLLTRKDTSQISNQARGPAELKHIIKRRKRNQPGFPQQRRVKREELKPRICVPAGGAELWPRDAAVSGGRGPSPLEEGVMEGENPVFGFARAAYDARLSSRFAWECRPKWVVNSIQGQIAAGDRQRTSTVRER